MASASDVLVAAAPQITPDAMRGWGIAEVVRWALTIRNISSDHANILGKNEITGEDLLDRVTEEKLVSVGMPLGPAGRILSALAAVKTAEATGPSSVATGKADRF